MMLYVPNCYLQMILINFYFFLDFISDALLLGYTSTIYTAIYIYNSKNQYTIISSLKYYNIIDTNKIK